MMPERSPHGVPVSKTTLGKVRRMLVERLTPEVLNPFARTPQNEALVRSTLAAICAEPELDLAINPVLIAESDVPTTSHPFPSHLSTHRT